MTNAEEQMDFDFGDPALNNPDYENTVNDAGNVQGGDNVTQTDEGATTDSAQQSETPEDAQDAQQTSAQDSPRDGGDKAGTRDQQQQRDNGATRPDKHGNLVDKDGKIVAAAGAERRHFERVQQQQRYITQLERDLHSAKSDASMHGALNGVPEKLGLNLQETEMGMQIMSSFKKDPVATARWALQETMRMGYNLQQIVGDNAPGTPQSGPMDLQAVRSMINDAVAPLVGDRKAQQRQQETEAAAQREYQAFIAKHEHASVHDDVLGRMLQSDSQLTPEAAYWQLIAYCARNSLDPSKPLREQTQSRAQSGQPASNGHAQPTQAQQPGMAMPNGGPPTANMQRDPDMAAPDDSWDSIVQNSLHVAGFN